jgi:hypothetical protein
MGRIGDIAYFHLSPEQEECLEFVIDDLGWYGCLGFIDDALTGKRIHFGPSPTSEPFFLEIYYEVELYDRNG